VWQRILGLYCVDKSRFSSWKSSLGVNSKLCDEIILKSTNFFGKAILKYHGLIDMYLSWVPYNASTDNAVGCENENCTSGYTTSAPAKASLYCPECRQLDKKEKKTGSENLYANVFIFALQT
jgi:hypothetical protein